MKLMRHATVWAVTGVLLLGLVGCSGETPRPEGLPEGLPSPVPVETGTVSNAVEGENQWSFSLTVKDKKEQQAALDKLTEAGFEIFDEATITERKTYALHKDGLNVTIVFDTVAGKPAVIYNVVEVPKEEPAD